MAENVGYEMFVGKRVKVVYRDKGDERAIRGIFLGCDDHTVIISGERDDLPIVIGKSALVMMRLDEQ